MNEQSVNRFSTKTEALLVKAGWFQGRDVLASVLLPEQFRIFPTAIKVLSEFGSLYVGESKAGMVRAQSTIVFEPILAEYEDDRFDEWADEIQSPLYPLGEIDNGLMFLAISENGAVYLVMERLLLVDTNFDTALEKLLEGGPIIAEILPIEEP